MAKPWGNLLLVAQCREIKELSEAPIVPTSKGGNCLVEFAWRSLKDVTAAVPEIVEAVQALPVRALILEKSPLASSAKMNRGRAHFPGVFYGGWYLNIDLEQRDHVTAFDPYPDLV